MGHRHDGKGNDMSAPIHPVSGAAGPGWTVEPGPGYCVPDERRIVVPLGATPMERRIRAHEMAHAVLSPANVRRPASMDPEAFQRAEDMRMNAYCREWGLDDAMDAVSATPEWIAERITRPLMGGDRLAAATAAMATYRTGDWAPVRDAIASVDPELARRIAEHCAAAWDRLAGGQSTFDDAMREAVRLQDAFGDSREDEPEDEPDGDGDSDGYSDGETDGETDGDPDGDGESGDGEPDGDPDGDGDPLAGLGEDDWVDDSIEGANSFTPPAPPTTEDDGRDRSSAGGSGTSVKSDGSELNGIDSREDADSVEAAVQAMLRKVRQYARTRTATDEWGDMELIQPRLALPLPPDLEGRQPIAADVGRAPRYMNRYCSDRRVFRGDGRRPGGASVLLDCSGSMNVAPGDIKRIVEMLPGSIIGAYAGDYPRGTDGEYDTASWGGRYPDMEGELWIIARDGRRVRDCDLMPHVGRLFSEGTPEYARYRNERLGGNVVDGPALEWLARQPGPRYWVSDGYVVGKREITQNLAEDAAAICRRASILRIDSMPELIRRLEDRTVARHR